MIPERVERRACWVLATLGAHDVRLGHELPYDAGAWEQVDRGERPGDELADAFFHLARIEERSGPRDRHGRFPASATCLDLLDPPLERLRRRLGIEPPRWRGGRFAVALTHDVDVPWRWTRRGVTRATRRVAHHVRAGHGRAALREARIVATIPGHKLRRTDPNWRFDRILALEGERGASSTFFVMAGHAHPEDGPEPQVYARLRPRLIRTLTAGGAEVGLHPSYTAADDEERLAREKRALEALAGPVAGQRYHFLRVDPHRNLAPLARLGFSYDASLGFAAAPGFRAGIAHPFRPWDLAADRALDLVEIPLAAMDTTFGSGQYLGLSAAAAEGPLFDLVDRAAEHGGGFALLWHSGRFDGATAAGWDRLYERLLAAIGDRGGVCLTAGALAEEAAAWLR